MRPSSIIILTLCILTIVPAFGETVPPVPTPNAAVGYLMAIGWMEPFPKTVDDEIRDLDTLEKYAALSTETVAFLASSKHVNVISMLKEGAKCEACRFLNERKYRPEEPVPPYRRIRELGRLARAIGFRKMQEKNFGDALEIFKAVFRLGQHMEQDGLLISGMIGLALKGISLPGFKALLDGSADPGVKDRAKEFLKNLPPSTAMTRFMAECEKRCGMVIFDMIRNDPNPDRATMEDLMKQIAPQMVKTPSEEPPAPVSPLKGCLANQRIMTGATEMMMMDFGTVPATVTAELFAEFLVKTGYLKKSPACEEGGKYKFTPDPKAGFICACTVHPTPDQAAALPPEPPKTVTPAQLEEFRTFLKSPEFASFEKEYFSMFDEILALDPATSTFKESLDGISERIEKSGNSLVKALMPSFKRVYTQQFELDDKIKALVK